MTTKTEMFRMNYTDAQGVLQQRRLVRERDAADKDNKTISYRVETNVPDQLGNDSWRVEHSILLNSSSFSSVNVVVMAMLDAALGYPAPDMTL